MLPSLVDARPLVVKARTSIALSLEKIGDDFALVIDLRDDNDTPLGNGSVSLTVHDVGTLELLTDALGRITINRSALRARNMTLGRQEYTFIARFAGDPLRGGATLTRRFNLGPESVMLRFDSPPKTVETTAPAVTIRVSFGTSDVGGVAGHHLLLQMPHLRGPLRAVTDINGLATFKLLRAHFPRPGRHTVTVAFPGSSALQKARASERIQFARRSWISLRADLERPQDRFGRRLVLNGRLHSNSGPLGGQKVSFDDRRNPVGTATTDADGHFRLALQNERIPTGDLSLTARFLPRSDDLLPSKSRTITRFVAPFPTIPLKYYLLPLGFMGLALLLVGLRRLPWAALRGMISATLGRSRPGQSRETERPVVEFGHRTPAAAPPGLATHATLLGQLYDIEAALPLPHGQITVSIGGATVATIGSDHSGWFRIEGLPPGPLVLGASHTGFVPEEIRVRLPHGGEYYGFRLNLTSFRAHILKQYRRLLRETYPGRELWGSATPRELVRMLMDRIPKGHDRLQALTSLFERSYFGEVAPTALNWREFAELAEQIRQARP